MHNFRHLSHKLESSLMLGISRQTHLCHYQLILLSFKFKAMKKLMTITDNHVSIDNLKVMFHINFHHAWITKSLKCLKLSLKLVMGLGQNFLTWVGSIFCGSDRVGSGQVSHLWFGFEIGKCPLKTSIFSIFLPLGQIKSLRVGSKSTGIKGRSASYLLWVKSKLWSGQVRAHL